MSKLIAHRLTPSSHPALIEHMRVLYNESIPFTATKPLSYLSPVEQRKWWLGELDRIASEKVIIHLYSPIETPWLIVAFSKVTDRGYFVTPFFAIWEAYWGRGYGAEIIEHYLSLGGDKPFHGEQLKSNGAIRHLNAKAGWVVTGSSADDTVEFLNHPGQSGDRQQEIYDEIIRYQEEGS